MKSNAPIRIIFILSAFNLFLFSCNSAKLRKLEHYRGYYYPPGAVQVTDAMFFDKCEIANIDYREYLYWTMRVFGTKSDEYQNALPDTMVWMQTDSCLFSFTDFYFRSPGFNYYPLVGVTQAQALDYCKWRRDRVFEYILVQNEKIAINTTASPTDYFTVEKYFAGQYKNYKPDSAMRWYVEYTLPDSLEYDTLRKYVIRTDSLAPQYFKRKYIKTYGKNSLVVGRPYHIFIGPVCCGKQICINPTVEIYSGHVSLKEGAVLNFFGNVQEWGAKPNFAYGGSWISTLSNYDCDSIPTTEPNAWTGFRCVARWKKWPE